MESKSFNIISKILILIFGIASLFLGFERIEILGVITNPSDTFFHRFYFGMISYPSRVDGTGYGIWYNNVIYNIFVLTFIVGFFLNFGYFEKKKDSRIRKNLALMSVALMSVGLIGSVSSPILTLIIFEIPPTTITWSFNLILLPGFYMAIIVIIIVFVEFITIEKTKFFRKEM
ncbi:MAG: hypothetical protein ACFFDN_35225 [Candidatus Hodarchaeota archaeon]